MMMRSKTADNMLSQRIRQMTFLAFLSDDGLPHPERPPLRGGQADPAGCLMGEAEMIQQQDNEGRRDETPDGQEHGVRAHR
jgi:hypothetical protein